MTLIPDPLTAAGLFNLLEGLLWWILAGIAWHRGRPAWLAIALAAFGVSDWIEAHTGAWWSPPGLLVLKGGCLIAISVGLWQWYRESRPDPGTKKAGR